MSKTKTTEYYTLIVKEPDGIWSIHFGDYIRACVEDERNELMNGWAIEKKDILILPTNDDQDSIDSAVDAINTMQTIADKHSCAISELCC